jgi:hypothetical protein
MRYKLVNSLLLIIFAVLLNSGLWAQTVDDFNRATLGSNWTADPEYVIASNTLDNNATTASWNYLAVYNAAVNATEVSFKWASAPLCDTEGANSGGIAIYLDSPSVSANGYFILRRYTSLDLHPIVSGVIDRATSIHSVTPTQSNPVPGTIIKVVPSTDGTGHHFDFYVNGVFDGRLNDAAKRYGNGTTLYAGVGLYGNRTNNVDDFTIKTSSSSSITVTSPNGGETWYANSHHNITWTSSGFTGAVKIELSTDSGSTWSQTVIASTDNTGTYDWTVPTLATLPSNNCRIRVSNASGSTPLDISNSNFSIAAAQIPKVLKPNGAELWIANTTQQITWQGFASANVRIRYRIQDTDPWTDITTSTTNDGLFEWTVPAQFTETAKIRVSDPAEVAESDESDAYFTITALAKLSVPDASGQPSTTGNVVYVWMNNQTNIRGVFFDIEDSLNVMTGERVISTGRATGFTVSYRETGSLVRVAMVHMSGQVIPVGNGAIAQINYATSGAAVIGSHSTLRLKNVTISDANGALVSPQLVVGNFYFMELGNLDGLHSVDNADLVIARDLVLKRRPPSGYEMLAGDLDHDRDVDLFDFLGIFDMVY